MFSSFFKMSRKRANPEEEKNDEAPALDASARSPDAFVDDDACAEVSRDESERGMIYLTVEWISRTRGRSNEGQGARLTCAGVPLHVSTRLSVRQLIDSCVELPPGCGEESCMLNWGTLALGSGPLHGREEGGWMLDVTVGAKLTLIVPSGTLLKHPALARATKGKMSLPKALMVDPNALLECTDDETQSLTDTPVFLEQTPTLNEPSQRALHPGRTDDNGIAALIRDHKVFESEHNGSIVDVGSGCGSLCAGLARAFPDVNVCGIECQEELIAESRKNFRDVDFVCGRAEKVLHTCRTAKVVIATTHNFDSETTNHILRVAAGLPLLTHLIVNVSNLCRPSCRSTLKLCCCFEPLETREIKTHWGNSFLNFTIYKRHWCWPYESNALPRGAKTAMALINGTAHELLLHPHKSEEISE